MNLNTNELNHFWGSVEERKDTEYKKYTRIWGYIIYNNDVYSVGKMDLYGDKSIRKNFFCDDVKKVARLNDQKQEYVSGGCLGELGCYPGGFKTTLWTQEDQLKDLALYTQRDEGKVEKTTYRNLEYMPFRINFGSFR